MRDQVMDFKMKNQPLPMIQMLNLIHLVVFHIRLVIFYPLYSTHKKEQLVLAKMTIKLKLFGKISRLIKIYDINYQSVYIVKEVVFQLLTIHRSCYCKIDLI